MLLGFRKNKKESRQNDRSARFVGPTRIYGYEIILENPDPEAEDIA